MRFFYRQSEDGSGWLAEAETIDACGRGTSPAAAVLDLRDVLSDRFDRPYAVGPPSKRPRLTIELEPIDQVLRPSLLDEEEAPRP
jgi:hypothetical protein